MGAVARRGARPQGRHERVQGMGELVGGYEDGIAMRWDGERLAPLAKAEAAGVTGTEQRRQRQWQQQLRADREE